ncbi:MAG: amidohydrolase family protein, partial [Calditrichia bacterium]
MLERLVFKGGTIVDGSGGPEFESDVIIEGDQIVSIGKAAEYGQDKVIDISGMVLSPGFVDIHSHSDYYLLIDSLAHSKVRQGVTTELGGNCGYSAAPIGGAILEDRKKGYKEQFALAHEWRYLSEYFYKLRKGGISLNYAHLIGANTIRGSVMGYDNRKPDKEELHKMRGLINQGLDDGAFGISFGMVYVPVCYADREELVILSKAAFEKGGIITTHIRSEGRALLEAIEEVISIARDSGAQLQISHLKTMGEENWGKIDRVFSMIEDAICEGVQITCDRYP